MLGVNNCMLEVFAKSGFRVKRSTDAGVVHLSFPTGETEASRQASELRNWTAAGESIRKLLHPRSVAVIGASRTRGKLGGALLANLQRAGFNGPVYPINPAASEVMGLRCYPSGKQSARRWTSRSSRCPQSWSTARSKTALAQTCMAWW